MENILTVITILTTWIFGYFAKKSKFINNNLLITTSDSILTSEDEIKQFIIQNIYNYNLNEIFLSKEIANSLIEWIKSK